MRIEPVKTEKIVDDSKTIFEVLDKAISEIKDGSIIVITSKIVSLCEGSFISKNKVKDKDTLVKAEADFYIPRSKEKAHSIIITLKNGVLSATAGIDESNASNRYVFWPKNPYESAEKIRKYLKKKHSVKKLGVIITDSKTLPSRRGIIGFALAYSGIKPLKKYVGQKDIFGRRIEITFANIVDALAAVSVLVMGEGNEQTPIVVIEDCKKVEFCDRAPSEDEIRNLNVEIEEDLYYPFLSKADWRKGGGGWRGKKR